MYEGQRRDRSFGEPQVSDRRPSERPDPVRDNGRFQSLQSLLLAVVGTGVPEVDRSRHTQTPPSHGVHQGPPRLVGLILVVGSETPVSVPQTPLLYGHSRVKRAGDLSQLRTRRISTVWGAGELRNRKSGVCEGWSRFVPPGRRRPDLRTNLPGVPSSGSTTLVTLRFNFPRGLRRLR